MRIIYLIAIVVAVGSGFGFTPDAFAQTASEDALILSDLGTFLEVVKSENPSIRSGYVGAEASARKAAQVRTLPDPIFGFGFQPIPIVTARGSQRTQWQLQQAIPFPGKLRLRGEAADWAAAGMHARAETAELDFVHRAKLTFFDLQRVAKQEVLVREFQESLESYEQVALTRYNVGAGVQQDILKAQLERNSLMNRLLELSKAKTTLLERLGMLANRRVTLGDSINYGAANPRLEESLSELLEIAQAERPEYLALEAEANRQDALVGLARLDWRPDFGVAITYFDIANGDVPASADGRDALAVGLSVRIPLQRERLRARLEESRLRREQVSLQQEALDTASLTSLADLHFQLQREADQIALFEEALIPQASTTLAATLSGYTTGRAGFLDLLDAERMLFNLRWSLIASRSELLKTGASLERELGIEKLSDLLP